MSAPVLAPTDITPGVFSGTPAAGVAVSVRGLSKSYSIAKNAEKHSTMGEALMHKLRHPFQQTQRDTFWALNDVSFDIQKGDVVGIIGRNGAGKSTLLKILSRITEPTRGRIDLYGRVGSLLEVGTGFHPELTGRENIYLNGAILGMSKGEIARQFDAIVDFSGTEQFLDTPVKRYSSGMYVRLAFAVAAHLKSEILVIDEVLAVGDAEFQKKCLGKMEDVAKHGRTVIFVSHSMPMVLRLCNNAVLLKRGEVVAAGTSREITRRYLESGTGSPAERVWDVPGEAPGDTVAQLRAVRILNANHQVSEYIDIHRPMFVEIVYNSYQNTPCPTAAFHLINEDGVTLLASADFNNKQWRETTRNVGEVRSTCRIPGNFLAEGHISVLAAVCSYNPDVVHAVEADAVSFEVVDQTESDGVRGETARSWPGVVRPMLDWEVSYDSKDNQKNNRFL